MNPSYAPVFRSGMLSVMSKRNDSAERWREILRRQESSGLSVAAFCRRSRIPQATFYLWRRKLRDVGARSSAARNEATFSEVRISPAPVPAGGALELVLPGGRIIVVRPGFDRTTLSALVDVLERGTSHDGMAAVRATQAVHDGRESGP